MASAPFLAEKICYLREVQVVEIGVKASHRIRFIRKGIKNRRDTGYDQRKTSRPLMRKMQTCRIFRIWPEARSLKFYYCKTKYSTIGTIGITVYANSRNKQNKKLLYFELFDKSNFVIIILTYSLFFSRLMIILDTA